MSVSHNLKNVSFLNCCDFVGLPEVHQIILSGGSGNGRNGNSHGGGNGNSRRNFSLDRGRAEIQMGVSHVRHPDIGYVRFIAIMCTSLH